MFGTSTPQNIIHRLLEASYEKPSEQDNEAEMMVKKWTCWLVSEGWKNDTIKDWVDEDPFK